MTALKIRLMASAGAIMLAFSGESEAFEYVPPVSIPEQLMHDLEEDLGLTDYQAAGIVGNLGWETGNFRFLQEMRPLVRNSRGGIGYAQWTGVRRVAFENHAGEDDLWNYATNYAFLIDELSGPYASVLEDLRVSETIRDATQIFMNGYLRPSPRHANFERRLELGQAYLAGSFEDAGCLSRHEIVSLWGRMAIEECPTDISTLRPPPRPDDLVARHGEQHAQRDTLRPPPRPEHLSRFQGESTPGSRTVASFEGEPDMSGILSAIEYVNFVTEQAQANVPEAARGPDLSF